MEKKEKKIDYKYNLKEYFKTLKNYKLFVFLALIVVLITEFLFLADKFLYKKLIDDSEKFISGALNQPVFVENLLILALVFGIIIIVRSFGRAGYDYFTAIINPKISAELRKKYFNHVLSLDIKFHNRHKTGGLLSKLSRGVAAFGNLNSFILWGLLPPIIGLTIVIISFSFISITPIIILMITSISFVFYSLWTYKEQNKIKKEANKYSDIENSFINDSLTNVESIKYYGKEKKLEKLYSKILKKVQKLSTRFNKFYSKIELIQLLIFGFGTLAILFFAVKDFLKGKITLGSVVLIYGLFGQVTGSLHYLIWGIRSTSQSLTDMQELLEYGKIQNEIKDKPNAKNLKIKKGEIEFRNVSFKYEEKENEREIFNHFNLKINPQEKVALVGHSGSGKTTVVKLLNRFYDVESGEILIDGEDIRNFKQESLRSETGIVPQEAILFDDTIYNNILFSKPSAKREEVLKAVKLAQLEKSIKNFPKGLDTIVGERGVKLSGGEKQRVSIARAILADKKVLVLDEATSALDSETENEIQKALEKLLEGRTSIIIAHRLSTIMKADRIIVLKEGEIIEQGSHQELLRKKGEYYKLWEMQSGGYLKD
ncbi:ABC transporter ATP-binding protein [archaeon]|nr:ABC transporter ATP-binding protein [archaeon]